MLVIFTIDPSNDDFVESGERAHCCLSSQSTYHKDFIIETGEKANVVYPYNRHMTQRFVRSG
jgi:hypothetical protein